MSKNYKALPVTMRDHLHELTGNELKVWLYLHLRTGKESTAYPGNQTIADHIGVSLDTVKDARASLRRKGWFSKESRRRNLDGTLSTVVEKTHLPWVEKATVEGEKTPHGTKVEFTSAGKTTQQKDYTENLEGAAAPIQEHLEGSALTCGNKETKEPLAPLAEGSENQQQVLSEFNSEEEEQQPQELHPSVWSLERIWFVRTQRPFTDEEKGLANKLIMTYRFRVVKAVLENTLWQRPKSAKLRWNKFSIFAKHWDRNHEEYLAYCATPQKGGGHLTALSKFSPVPEEGDVDPQEWNSLTKWFKQTKIGDWTFEREDWEAMGFTRPQVYTALLYCGEEGIGVTKEAFTDLIREVAGIKAVGAAAGCFDPEEA
jgi:hypothetical protein